MKVMVCMSMLITLVSVFKWFTIMKIGIFCGIATFVISMAYCGENLVELRRQKKVFILFIKQPNPILDYVQFFLIIFFQFGFQTCHHLGIVHNFYKFLLLSLHNHIPWQKLIHFKIPNILDFLYPNFEKTCTSFN